MPNYFLLPAAKSKRAVFWSLCFFACSQLALGLYLHWRHPELRDPVYGSRIRSLKERLAEEPERPLVLVLGSSRAMNGLAPAAFPICTDADGRAPLIYNFAISGSGSIRQLMTFRRILSAGIRPQRVLVETWPPMWAEEGGFDEKQSLEQDEPGWADVPLLCRYLPGKREVLTKALRGSLVPLLSYRARLLHVAARSLLPRQQAWKVANEMRNWHSTDGTGWLPALNCPDTLEAKRREIERGRKSTEPLLNPVRIHAAHDRTLRDLLDECRARGIQTALLLMPEHSECRRWYSPQARALVGSYLGGLGREYHIPVIDTRDWLPDEDFADFCHMAPPAAAPFSQRFGREVLRPWLAGETLNREILLKEQPSAQGDCSPDSGRPVPPTRPPARHNR